MNNVWVVVAAWANQHPPGPCAIENPCITLELTLRTHDTASSNSTNLRWCTTVVFIEKNPQKWTYAVQTDFIQGSILYINIEPLCYTPETNMMLYVNYASIKKEYLYYDHKN